MTLATMDGQKLIKTCQALELLGVTSPSTLYRWRQQGLLPVFRTPGGHLRYREADIMALVKEDVIQP